MIWKKVIIQGVDHVVRVGDIVYFWKGCNFSDSPQIAVIESLGTDAICDLLIFNSQLGRQISERSVCLFGDERLQQSQFRSKGCWTVRPPVEDITASPQREG